MSPYWAVLNFHKFAKLTKVSRYTVPYEAMTHLDDISVWEVVSLAVTGHQVGVTSVGQSVSVRDERDVHCEGTM